MFGFQIPITMEECHQNCKLAKTLQSLEIQTVLDNWNELFHMIRIRKTFSMNKVEYFKESALEPIKKVHIFNVF